MSYTSPKYTYVSQQPAFDKLQRDVVGAAQTVAAKRAKAEAEKKKELEAEKLKGELLTSKGGEASAKHVRDTLGASPDDFTDYGRGVVENYFKGKGKLVGDLTMKTSGPNAQCKTDGNCEELQLELAKLQEQPAKIKGMLETLLDQLDWKSIQNFDSSQNPELIAVSNVMSGIGEFAKEPYGYEMVDGKDGKSIDLVFTGPEDVFPGGKYTINSKQLEAATGPGGAPLFQTTQSPGVNQGNVMQNTEILQGATFDEKGNYVEGGTFIAENYIKFNVDEFGNKIPSAENYIETTDKKGGSITRAVINESMVREDIKLGVAQTLQENFGIGSDQGIDDGQIRTYFNKVLMGKSWAKNLAKQYDEDQLREVFGTKKDDGTFIPATGTVEELKTRWGKVFNNWSTKEDLTDDQLKVFEELFLKQQTQSITQAMQYHPSNIVQIDITNLPTGTIEETIASLPGR